MATAGTDRVLYYPYPYYAGFSVLFLPASWLRLVCLNLPFAFFGQLLFIQPLVRSIFRAVFLPRGAAALPTNRQNPSRRSAPPLYISPASCYNIC